MSDHDPLSEFLKESGFVSGSNSEAGSFQPPLHISELEMSKG